MSQISNNAKYNIETLKSKSPLKNETIYKTLIGLLSMGCTNFSDVEQFRHNEVFTKCLDLEFTPAQETLRLYLEKEITEDFIYYCNLINIELLKKVTYSCEKITNKYIPLDFDVTTMLNPKCKKEGCSRTYKGKDRFAPLMSYLGYYCIGAELRPGKQHSQKDSIPFVQKVLNDANEILSPEDLLERAKSLYNKKVTYSYRKTSVYYGYFTELYPLGKEYVTDKAQIAFKIKECYENKNGDSLLFPEIEVDLYWTNLAEDAQTIVDLYKDPANSEQFHNEIKTDLNFERLVSGDIDRIRIKTVLRDIIYTSARYMRKGKDMVLRLYNKNPWTKLLLRLDDSINKYFPILV
ncbi:MAG: transposase [Spirochaetaceae bacterium]|nr:transposase [Spirochaetaceae bacterium]